MNENILSQLKDVHIPKEPSLWPLAFGYYILIALFVFIILALYFIIKKQRPKWRLKKQIKVEFNAIKNNFNRDNNINLLQNNLVSLVRRIDKHKNLANNNLRICVENLWGNKSENEEFLTLLEHDRFKKISTTDAQRLLSLAHKKFNTCKL